MSETQRAFMEWYGIQPAPAALLEKLYEAKGATVTYRALTRALGVAHLVIRGRAMRLHEAMDPGSLTCVTRLGYRLTVIGLTDCERALDDLAGRRAA